MRFQCLVLAAVAQLAPAASAPEPAQPQTAADAKPEALVRRVSLAYAEEMRGIVGLRTRTELTVDGPMYHRQLPSAPWYVYDDGALVSSSEAPDARRPLVRDALRPGFLSEYHFGFAPCSECAAGDIAVAYDSPQHDTFHAHGYFVIETATERVLRSVEIPYELPWPTRDGRLEVTWGVAGKSWLPVSVAGTFSGKVGPFRGTARYTQQLSPYEHYPRLGAAVEALTAATGATPAPDFASPSPAP